MTDIFEATAEQRAAVRASILRQRDIANAWTRMLPGKGAEHRRTIMRVVESCEADMFSEIEWMRVNDPGHVREMIDAISQPQPSAATAVAIPRMKSSEERADDARYLEWLDEHHQTDQAIVSTLGSTSTLDAREIYNRIPKRVS